jgi:hypothetical protein
MLPYSVKEPIVFSPAAEAAESILRQRHADLVAARRFANDVLAGDPDARPMDESGDEAPPPPSPEAIAEARRAAEDGQPRWLIRVPSVMDRAAFRRDLAEEGASYAGDIDLFAAARAGLRALAPSNLADLLGDIDAFEALDPATRYLDQPAVERLDRILELLRGVDDTVTRLLAARGYWMDVLPLVAARRFLIGAVGEKPLRRSGPWVEPAAFEAIAERHGLPMLMQIGWRAHALMQLNRTAEKN